MHFADRMCSFSVCVCLQLCVYVPVCVCSCAFLKLKHEQRLSHLRVTVTTDFNRLPLLQSEIKFKKHGKYPQSAAGHVQ